MKCSVLIRGVWCVFALAYPAAAQQIDLTGWFAFNPAKAVAAGTAVDASTLLVDVPGEDVTRTVGRRGRLKASPAGQFYFENTGRRARFFGTNCTFSACFPPSPDAPAQTGEYGGTVPADVTEQLADRLARMGANLVRFHHMDNQNRPGGIWDPAFPSDTQHLDALQLRRLDYFIYQLKRRGIYSNVNLHVSRVFRSGDGVAEYNRFDSGEFNRPATQFDPVMIELQKKYARDLLGHLNPYTGLRLADDPAVAFVEISNEDSLLHDFGRDVVHYDPNRSGTLPPYYSAQLDRLWNEWLKRRYTTREALAQAWQGSGEASSNFLVNPSFEDGLQGWGQNRISGAQANFAATATGAWEGAQAARVDVTSVTGTNWHVQLLQRGLTLESGKRYEVVFAARSTSGFPVDLILQRDIDPYTGYASLGTFRPTSEWQVYRASFRSNYTEKEHVQLVFNIGSTTGTVWFDAVSFANVVPVGLEAGEDPAAGTVERPRVTQLGRYTDARARDVAQFYFDTQRAYFDEMARFLREDVGTRALITGTAPYWFYPGDIEIQAGLDFVDGHIYFDHPWWPSVPAWSSRGWVMNNRPFALDPFQSLFNIAASAVAGKPFTLSETNQPFPNDYQAEWLLWMAAFGNFQDWDEVLQFDYGGSPTSYFADHSRTFFSIAGNALKTAQMPVAAHIFLGAQNRAATGRANLAAPHDELMLVSPATSAASYFGARNIDPTIAFHTAVRIARFEGSATSPGFAQPNPALLSSDNGELTLDRTQPSAPFFQAAGSSVNALSGFLAGRTCTLPAMTVALAQNTAAFAAVTLQAIDRRTLDASERLLLSVLTRYQNTGMVWNSTRTSVDDRWGTAPALIEPAAGTITFRLRPDVAFGVYALDAEGKRTERVGGGRGEFQLAVDTGRHRTVWYELAADSPADVPRALINEAGAVNAASYRAQAAPGMLLSIFGVNLAPTTAGAEGFPLPTELAGTSVLIAGQPAPLLYVSPLQVNAQLPFSVPPGPAEMVVVTRASTSPALAVAVEAAAPGIFVAVPQNVRAGEYVTVYATGLGALATTLAPGLPAPVIPVTAQVTAVVGGVPAEVTYAGTAPGFAGLNQVNVRIPAAAPSGPAEVVLGVAGKASNAVTVDVTR